MESSEHNNFFLGFVVGALTGVSGYFLTKTEEGKEIKERFKEEWGEVRNRLEEAGVITKEEESIVDIISKFKTHLNNMTKNEKNKQQKKVKRGRPKKKVVKKKRKTKKLFKGV